MTKIKRAAKLIGQKVILTPLLKKDVPLFHKWISDLEVAKYTELASRVMTLYDEIDWYKETKENKEKKFFAILDKKSARTIGTTGLNRIESVHRRAIFGIMIGDKNYWGKGYGSETIRLVLDFGFNVLNLNSIYLTVYDFNQRAIRAYEKAGFKKAGRFRQAKFCAGRYHDEILMDLLASEFKNSQIKMMI